MIVGGMPGLFPLSKLNPHWNKYFMNASGDVFSTKTSDTPRKLNGSHTTSGRYYALSPSSGYGSQTELATRLVNRARAHVDFHKETQLTQPHQSEFNKLRDGNGQTALEAMKDRDHAPSLQAGIKGRGYVIARVEGEALVFGSKPVVHTTLKSVTSEIERLANKTPGLQLVYLKIEGAVRAAKLVWE